MAESILPAIATMFAGQMSSNASSTASKDQIGAMQAGNAEQRQFGNDMFNYDNSRNYDAGQYLKDQMPEFDMTRQNAPDPNQFFGDAKVNQYYDTAKSNLNNQMNTSIGNAQSSFGANAASRGLANPSAGMAMVGNQTAQNFIPQFGKLEENRAGAMLGNQQNLFNANMQSANFNSGQNQILNSLKQLGYGNKSNFAQQYGNPNSPYKPFEQHKYTNSGTDIDPQLKAEMDRAREFGNQMNDRMNGWL